MRTVVALGGNALLQRGDKPDAGVQLIHVRAAARALAPLADEHDLLICHGNGPQVGMLALESASDATLSRPYPLDDLVAQTQGMIGYWLVQSLRNAGVTKPIVGLITQTQVDPADPAFTDPSKFVGPGYSHEQAQQLASQHGWSVAADGECWRRVVASPQPQRVVEQDSITGLLDAGAVVICGGGGGAAVTEDSNGHLAGEGCRRFVAATGHPATIGSLTEAEALLAGTAGTTITNGKYPLATPSPEPHVLTARKSA